MIEIKGGLVNVQGLSFGISNTSLSILMPLLENMPGNAPLFSWYVNGQLRSAGPNYLRGVLSGMGISEEQLRTFRATQLFSNYFQMISPSRDDTEKTEDLLIGHISELMGGDINIEPHVYTDMVMSAWEEDSVSRIKPEDFEFNVLFVDSGLNELTLEEQVFVFWLHDFDPVTHELRSRAYEAEKKCAE
jgi:hypothetical protein